MEEGARQTEDPETGSGALKCHPRHDTTIALSLLVWGLFCFLLLGQNQLRKKGFIFFTIPGYSPSLSDN